MPKPRSTASSHCRTKCVGARQCSRLATIYSRSPTTTWPRRSSSGTQRALGSLRTSEQTSGRTAPGVRVLSSSAVRDTSEWSIRSERPSWAPLLFATRSLRTGKLLARKHATRRPFPCCKPRTEWHDGSGPVSPIGDEAQAQRLGPRSSIVRILEVYHHPWLFLISDLPFVVV